MIDLLLQIGFLTVLFMPAVLSVFYISYLQKRRIAGPSLRNLALFVVSLAGLVAVCGVFIFRGENATELMLNLPNSSEYFEVSLNLSQARFYWILGCAALYINYLVFWGEDAFSGSDPILRYLYFFGAFFAAAIVFLAEQVPMALIFVEISFFLSHAFFVLAGTPDGGFEKISYFRRSAFIFIGLALMMFFYLVKLFSTDSIILCGMSLYVMSLLFSKQGLSRWSRAVPGFFPIMLALFVFFRVLHPGLASELWFGLSILFGFFALGLAITSLLSRGALNAFYWWTLAIICNFLAMQFASGMVATAASAILSILTVITLSACAPLLEKIPTQDSLLQRQSARAFLFVVYAIAVGGLPGISMALMGRESSNYFLILHFFLVFFFAAALGKMAFVREEQKKKQNKSAMLPSIIFAGFLIVLHYVAWIILSDEKSLSNNWWDLNADEYLYTAIALGLIFLGALTSFFLSRNQAFTNFLIRRERVGADMLPRIDPRILRINFKLVTYPQEAADAIAVRAVNAAMKVSQKSRVFEERVLQNELWVEAHAYLFALSRYVRFFHRGTVRFYVFAALVLLGTWSLFLVFS